MDYINNFLKLKAEASGYPSWVRSPADEDRYVRSFWDSEGIRLDKESIKHNCNALSVTMAVLPSSIKRDTIYFGRI